MCGRFSQISQIDVLQKKIKKLDLVLLDTERRLEEIIKHFGHENGERHNIAPTDPALVLYQNQQKQLCAQSMQWGLIPRWWSPTPNQPKALKPYNARLESLSEKPTFKASYHDRRCLIPADGYFEFKDKQPYWFSAQNNEPFFFAGLWDEYTPSKNNLTLQTFTIITLGVQPHTHPLTCELHPQYRMPAILNPEQALHWIEEPFYLPAYPEAKLHRIEANPKFNQSMYKGSDYIYQKPDTLFDLL